MPQETDPVLPEPQDPHWVKVRALPRSQKRAQERKRAVPGLVRGSKKNLFLQLPCQCWSLGGKPRTESFPWEGKKLSASTRENRKKGRTRSNEKEMIFKRLTFPLFILPLAIAKSLGNPFFPGTSLFLGPWLRPIWEPSSKGNRGERAMESDPDSFTRVGGAPSAVLMKIPARRRLSDYLGELFSRGGRRKAASPKP